MSIIDKLWKSSDGCFNPSQPEETLTQYSEKKKYKNLTYYTQSFDIEFDNVDNVIIFGDMTRQQDHIRKLISLYEKHEYFNKAISEKLYDQYNNFYFYKGHYYQIDELKLRLIKKSGNENTFIRSEKPDLNNNQKQQILEKELSTPTITVSREAIRKITKYSPYVVPSWGTKQVYIEWQDIILQDDSLIILVDGSRQIGKSLTIAEKATELSFMPNEDTLVGGYIKKTTDVIRNYMLKHIKGFPEGVFEHFKSEGYIFNTKSGTRIYFRTLDNDAQNVLGLTLKNIIVDEAQLVDSYVFEEVLEPTLSTTNGRMILIGTPGRTAKGYYYDLIMEAKKGIEQQGLKIAVKSESNPNISYYQIDYTQNPLISPNAREKIVNNIGKASIQRQYCCNWNSGEDQLFKPHITSDYPILSNDGYFTITFDPARKGIDRSAFCVTYTYNGRIYGLISGFVPKMHKGKWSKQIDYYSKGLIKSFIKYKNLTTGVDLRGIGEGFTEAWKNHFKPPEPSLSLIEITYTTGEVEKIDGLDFQVSKTILISNGVDMIEEGLISILGAANKDLLEEFQFIYESEDNKKRLAMKTTYLDDITNCFLTNLYIIHKRGYLKRSKIIKENDKNVFDDWGSDFVLPKYMRKKINKQAW